MATNKNPQLGALDADAQAETIALTRVDKAGAVARPIHVGPLHVETEYTELEAEQPPLFDATGIEASRIAEVEAAGLGPAVQGDERLLTGHLPILAETESRMVATRDALASFRRRPPKAKGWHYAAKAALLGGDLAGIATAAIWMGEIPAIAVVMAIGALRMAIEEPLVGLVFGGIAAAIAAASWVESFMHGDAASDLIDNADADYQRELARHQTLSRASAWKRREETLKEVDSITREHTQRGVAAAHHLRALKARVLRGNPGVAGHGPAAEPTAIGQTARRSGGAK